jgi:hypothetical protein
MSPEQEKRIKECVEEIAAIFYEETSKENLTSLAKIEQEVREQTQRYINPKIGFFLSQELQERNQDILEK